MTTAPSYGARLRQQAFWSLLAQAAAVTLPGLALAAAGVNLGLERTWLLGAGIWAMPRALGAAGLWSLRRRPVSATWPTRTLFRLGVAACWIPAITAVALLGGWGLVAAQGDPSPLMAIAELDNTLSIVCLAAGAAAFGLGFWFGRPPWGNPS